MTHRRHRTHFIIAVFSILMALIACSGSSGSFGGNTVTVEIVYGSEKEDWFEVLIDEYNQQDNRTESGARIEIVGIPMGSISSMTAILNEEIQPTVWSPAASIYLPIANDRWRDTNSADLVNEDANALVLSPVVIAMWEPMAQALGWPERQLGWEDISNFSSSEEGWEQYGFPEWGDFKLGHTHPQFSNSGYTSVLAEAYAGAGKQRDLTVEDLRDEEVRAFVEGVEKSIIHYGSSTGFFARRMFEGGPSYLSAAVLYENLIVAQEAERLAGRSQQLPVVAIYPKEGTFWSDHPYAILDAPWVTEEQTEAAELFEAYLLSEEQQERALQFGFRPADPGIAIGAPINAEHGVDPSQPQTVLEVPEADVLVEAWDLWLDVKKPVDLVVVMDISGSMSGQKIAAARTSLLQFIELLDDRDRLSVVLFNEELIELTPLTSLGEKRENISQRVSGVIECCGTRLYDGVEFGYNTLQTTGDPEHIRAIVVLSDGADTNSVQNLNQLIATVGDISEEGGNATKIFTIGYGNDADFGILESISESTGARSYEGSPDTINEVYIEIATFF